MVIELAHHSVTYTGCTCEYGRLPINEIIPEESEDDDLVESAYESDENSESDRPSGNE